MFLIFLRRFAFMGLSIFVVVTFIFLLVHLVPGDPVLQMLGEGAQPVDVQQLRHALGLDQPVYVQYIHYVGNLLHGNLGTSFRYQEPVLRTLLRRYPATMELSLASLVLALLFSIPAGIHAAVKSNTGQDRWISFFSLLGLSLPNFALGPLLILLFSIQLMWLPVSGIGGLSHLVLPAVTLGLGLAAVTTRMVRSAMLEELGQDYLRTALSKGLPRRTVLYKHALKNSMIPIVTVVGLQFGNLLAGTFVTESIFSWPGIGRLTLQAIQFRDYPLVQGCILAIALTYIGVNFLTDLAYLLVDPRIRIE
ncbi:MAG: ABC transporter permease [Acidobacteriia bacterium]|nr:ABC transporter permease [Terriglobia bacterium]